MTAASKSDKIAALAEEIRRNAEVYRSAVALAEMLELLGPYEEADERARTAAAAAQQRAAAAQAECTKVERQLAALRAEHQLALGRMQADFERLARAEEAKLDAALLEKRGQLTELNRSVANQEAYLGKITDEIARLRGLFA